MRLRKIFGIILWFALALPVFPAASDRSQDAVVYQPDFVGEGRLFMVALKIPTGIPDIRVKCPSEVVSLDRTRLPVQSDIRRFYFRAKKAAKKAEIIFSWPGNRVTVPIGIWSFEDLRQYRELKGTRLPRRWPLGAPLPELKTAQIFAGGK